MKIHMVCLEDGITSCGFRKMAAYVEMINPDTRTHYISTNSYRSMLGYVLAQVGDPAKPDPEKVIEISQELAEADLVCFSSMTGYAELTRAIAKHIRKLNPKTYMIWGGIHPIIHSDNAITSDVDAICTGEGEFAFEEFFDKFRHERDFTSTRNFWFKKKGEILRNGFLPLMTPAQMNTLPRPKYYENEWIYKPGHGFVPVSLSDYLSTYGLGYHTVWSIGCPFKCAYCGNTTFIKNDNAYRQLRHSSVDTIISEVKNVLRIHPHVGTICFHDDSFMAIPYKTLHEFAEKWRTQVGVSFAVYGVIPNYVQKEKVEILSWAGMNRVRIGIQSGSEKILRMYKRPSTPDKVSSAVDIINTFSRYHIPPSYDIIVDNPLEETADIVDTLELLYRIPRPYALNMFALRIIPNTVLEEQMKKAGVDDEKGWS